MKSLKCVIIRLKADKMSKPRKLKNFNKRLNDSLDLEGLAATGGDEDNIYVMNPDTTVPLCERCLLRMRQGDKPEHEARMRNHGKFEKKFFDVIKKPDGSFKVVTLHYLYYKYRCLDKTCPTIVQKPITFARENAHVTRRFEDYVVGLASFMSYSEISDKLMIKVTNSEGYSEYLQTVSKQAVSDIIKRWTEDRDTYRGDIHTPELLGLMKFVADGKEYIIAFDAGNKELRIIDVIPTLNSSDIEAFLRSFDLTKLKGVVTDCEPIVVEAAENVLTQIDVMVSIDAIMRQAIHDFDSLIHEDALRLPVQDKEFLRAHPDEIAKSAYAAKELRSVTERYPRLNLGYDYLNQLRGILSRDWDVTDISEWENSTPDKIKKYFDSSTMLVTEYWEQMLKYYMRRNEVTEDLYKKLTELNERINQFKFYSKELFKSRLLYIPDEYNETYIMDDEWHGVPYDNVMAALDDMQHEKEDAINERIWKRF